METSAWNVDLASVWYVNMDLTTETCLIGSHFGIQNGCQLKVCRLN